MFMTNLTHLSLAGNPIFVIDNLHSNTLAYLDLSNCLLGISGKSFREDAFTNLPKLNYLNISLNGHLTKLSSFEPLSISIKYLEASNCAFESPDVKMFPNLQWVEMRRNVIKTLHNEILSQNSILETLDVSENLISHIEERAFIGAKSLRKLDISQNFIRGLNWNVFFETPKLEVLNISRNLLKSLDDIPIPSLLLLDASRCEIVGLNSNILRRTKNLRYLNLSNNFVESIPPKLSSSKLLSIDLSYCRLTEVKHESFQELPSLRRLNLMGNRLTNPLNHSLLQEVRELNLQDNPWHCDCTDPDFGKAWHHLYLYPNKGSTLRNLKCHSPKEHSGMSWENSCFRVLGEGKKYKTAAWYSFLVPFLTVCCMIAIFMVVRQAYVSHGLEVEQRESSQRTSRRSETRATRVGPHFFDDDLERGIQMSVNESTQRSPIHDLSKLPSYEEALLMPKLLSQDDLKDIIRNYEERDRFEESTLNDAQERGSGINEQLDHQHYPSTSRNSVVNETRNNLRTDE
ncbi:insulin-like growth factor-binding protein complex acid labile subunit [Macrosteles quadrilineatus]|uniref:insulin-like growth factor-binding protein complex acid labile subunit n=1 Tax=Macrosteles quadrilineatus TaxID=74068 RepID=UPI0023E1BEEB|nr:insulin-like growth factor-binding protein complex acid labile subunit [Macrosteles quadrilineatus]